MLQQSNRVRLWCNRRAIFLLLRRTRIAAYENVSGLKRRMGWIASDENVSVGARSEGLKMLFGEERINLNKVVRLVLPFIAPRGRLRLINCKPVADISLCCD